MKTEVVQTDRGFARGDFIDHYGKHCSVQDSSLATEVCIWLGCDNGQDIEITYLYIVDVPTRLT